MTQIGITGRNTSISVLPAQYWTVPGVSIQPLMNKHVDEVLAFLSQRPMHTVFLAGLVRDNGVESPLNRGTFYACRNERNELEGVALIGHATLLETRTDRALEAFAQKAQACRNTFMIVGEEERIAEFWAYYAVDGRQMRLACKELLFAKNAPGESRDEFLDARLATLGDLELTMPVHAAMAEAESGVNPLETDHQAFRKRCARRIEQGRTWVLIKDNTLVFKADIQSDTPEVIYLEGVWVDPQLRGQGVGLACLNQLEQRLLKRTSSICLLVNEHNQEAQTFYDRAGYKVQSYYDTVFL